MIKQLTTEIVAQLDEDCYWFNEDNIPVSTESHLLEVQERGKTIPQEVFDYLNNDEVGVIYKEETPDAFKWDNRSGLHYYWDPVLERNLSVQVFSDGQGTNSSKVSVGDYLRRFNGSMMTNTRALARPYEIVMIDFCCTVESSTSGAYIDAIHFDIDGNDGVIVGRLPFNQQNNKMAAAWWDVKILIPANRRLTGQIGGGQVAYPQSYLSYRRVITVED